VPQHGHYNARIEAPKSGSKHGLVWDCPRPCLVTKSNPQIPLYKKKIPHHIKMSANTWSTKCRWNQKLIALFCCTLRDEHFESNLSMFGQFLPNKNKSYYNATWSVRFQVGHANFGTKHGPIVYSGEKNLHRGSRRVVSGAVLPWPWCWDFGDMLCQGGCRLCLVPLKKYYVKKRFIVTSNL
jgi:hypothetical protein